MYWAGWGRGEWGVTLRLVALSPDWSVGISTVDSVTYVSCLMQSDYYGLKSMTLSFFAKRCCWESRNRRAFRARYCTTVSRSTAACKLTYVARRCFGDLAAANWIPRHWSSYCCLCSQSRKTRSEGCGTPNVLFNPLCQPSATFVVLGPRLS